MELTGGLPSRTGDVLDCSVHPSLFVRFFISIQPSVSVCMSVSASLPLSPPPSSSLSISQSLSLPLLYLRFFLPLPLPPCLYPSSLYLSLLLISPPLYSFLSPHLSLVLATFQCCTCIMCLEFQSDQQLGTSCENAETGPYTRAPLTCRGKDLTWGE